MALRSAFKAFILTARRVDLCENAGIGFVGDA